MKKLPVRSPAAEFNTLPSQVRETKSVVRLGWIALPCHQFEKSYAKLESEGEGSIDEEFNPRSHLRERS